MLIDADPNARWINALIASDLKGMERRQSSLLERLRPAAWRSDAHGKDEHPTPEDGGDDDGPAADEVTGGAGAAPGR